ncbi:RNA polymerase sporulation sigma factor SigK [Limnochorda pilosa]|uniref:RNA polymerase sigma factor n=1 Tax=Limnochorda pilosa TaxID=1555112 RepID=A0A0K2SNN4_LIMPI|nr:RNA polymerase sporulation sigma factor SigK [Limnochorda pilosa]BAS28444.1 RNA polymerase sigma 70 [Limnochorda pilosa]
MEPLSTILSLFFGSLATLSGYLAGHHTFPLPLSPEEESRLLGEMHAGSEEARNRLIEHNLRLVAHLVKKFENTGEDSDDLISIGTIGLIKAIRTYDAGKNTRLATYAARCIENEILMHLRATRKLRGEVMLFDPIGTDKEGNEISLIDVLGSDGSEVADQVETEVESQQLRQKMGVLSNRERRVIELRYGLRDGLRYTQREISRRLGISRSYVSRIEKRALGKLHRQLAEGT